MPPALIWSLWVRTKCFLLATVHWKWKTSYRRPFFSLSLTLFFHPAGQGGGLIDDSLIEEMSVLRCVGLLFFGLEDHLDPFWYQQVRLALLTHRPNHLWQLLVSSPRANGRTRRPRVAFCLLRDDICALWQNYTRVFSGTLHSYGRWTLMDWASVCWATDIMSSCDNTFCMLCVVYTTCKTFKVVERWGATIYRYFSTTI